MLPPALRSVSPRELAQRLDAERRGIPLLVHLDGEGRQRLVELGDAASLTIGRSPSNPDVVYVTEGWTSKEAHDQVFAGEQAKTIWRTSLGGTRTVSVTGTTSIPPH